MKKLTVLIVIVMLMATTVFAGEGPSKSKKKSWGIGFGIPYGILGVNSDYNIAPNFNLTLGFGSTIFAGMAYNGGLKYYLASKDNSFRPKISAYYGTNAMKEKAGYYMSEWKQYTGLTLGIGTQWMWGKSKSSGLDFDVMYIATSGLSNHDDYGKIKISLGFRHGL